jgi:hypothetical protein
MLTPEKLEQVQRAAVEHYQRNLERLKTIGAVLTEPRTGTVNVDFVIGPEKVEGVKEFKKARIADDKCGSTASSGTPTPSSSRSNTKWPPSRPSCRCPYRNHGPGHPVGWPPFGW